MWIAGDGRGEPDGDGIESQMRIVEDRRGEPEGDGGGWERGARSG